MSDSNVWFCMLCAARSDSDLSTGYVKPTVLQGQYNLLARRGEADLLPVLRKHGIAYYAYSWVMTASPPFHQDADLMLVRRPREC